MKKFILPVINLIALVLSAVIFGLGTNSAVLSPIGDNAGAGNWYQLVWEIPQKLSVIALLGFFLFIVAVAVALFTMIPFKGRKFAVCLGGLMFVAAGVMFMLTPARIYSASYTKTDSYIAMIVLAYVAGGLELLGSLIEFLPEKK